MNELYYRKLLVSKLSRQGKQSPVVKALVWLYVNKSCIPDFLTSRLTT